MAVEARIKKQIKKKLTINMSVLCLWTIINTVHTLYKQMYEPLLPDIYLFATTVNFNVQLLSATESKALASASASEMQQNFAGLCKNSLDENGWYYIEKK